jgi:hypothetical protein
MRNAIRRGAMVAVVLACGAPWAGVRGDEASPSAGGNTPTQETATPAEPTREVFEPGAPSLEPAQAIEEDAGSRAHQAWVDSTHESP